MLISACHQSCIYSSKHLKLAFATLSWLKTLVMCISLSNLSKEKYHHRSKGRSDLTYIFALPYTLISVCVVHLLYLFATSWDFCWISSGFCFLPNSPQLHYDSSLWSWDTQLYFLLLQEGYSSCLSPKK